MATKVEAARIATGAGIAVVLTSAAQAAAGARRRAVGTLLHADGRPDPDPAAVAGARDDAARAGCASTPGAVRAVVDRRLSLLPAGITGVDGDFEAGDPVDLLDENGHAVARGLVNFDVDRAARAAGPFDP